MSKLIDLVGFRSGKLVVKEIHSRSRNGHIRWLCNCDCGKTHIVFGSHINRRSITHCGCTPYRGRQHKQWTGCGDISGNHWNQIVRGASGAKGRAKIELSITIEYIWDLYIRQNKRCILSGLPIWFKHTQDRDSSVTASLDRIDSSQGYVEGNVQWVHKDINKMKNSFEQNYFISLCRSISNNV